MTDDRRERLIRAGVLRPGNGNAKATLGQASPETRRGPAQGIGPRARRSVLTQSVRYWDASALVRLLLEQRRSEGAAAAARGGPDHHHVGCGRASSSRAPSNGGARRETLQAGTACSPRSACRASRRLGRGRGPVGGAGTRAIAILGRHPPRAADAGHLAAALCVADDDPSTLEFVRLDQRLAEAAEREGLRILT